MLGPTIMAPSVKKEINQYMNCIKKFKRMWCFILEIYFSKYEVYKPSNDAEGSVLISTVTQSQSLFVDNDISAFYNLNRQLLHDYS